MKGNIMKKEEQKSLTEINKSLQENIQLLPEECRQQLRPSMDDLEAFTSEYNQMMKVLRPLLLVMFAMIVILAALFGSFGYYSAKLEETIMEKNGIIRKYQYHDSIYSLLLDRNDSAEYVYYRIRNGKPVTYHQLERQHDSIQRLYYQVTNESERNADMADFYSAQLSKAYVEIDSLHRLCYNYRYENHVQKCKLDLVTKRYPITIKQDTNSVSVSAPKIDSALLLLPYYRENLKYDEKTKSWSIITIREKMIITERETNKRKKK